MQAALYERLQERNKAAHDAVNGQVRFKAFLDQFSKEVQLPLFVPGNATGACIIAHILLISQHYGRASAGWANSWR
jgi:hypothetical protein